MLKLLRLSRESGILAQNAAFDAWFCVPWFIKIEVCYREVKQNHCFGLFHSQNFETNFGQTMLSLVAYSFVQIQKLLLPSLNEANPQGQARHNNKRSVSGSIRSSDCSFRLLGEVGLNHFLKIQQLDQFHRQLYRIARKGCFGLRLAGYYALIPVLLLPTSRHDMIIAESQPSLMSCRSEEEKDGRTKEVPAFDVG